MRKCTGCGWIEGNPLGLNANQEQYLGCCPDSNYKEVTAMQELVDYVNDMWANEGWEEAVINKATSLIEKEKEQIMNAYLQGSFDDGPDSNNAEQYYNQTYHEEDDWGGLSNEELIGDDEIPKF